MLIHERRNNFVFLVCSFIFIFFYSSIAAAESMPLAGSGSDMDFSVTAYDCTKNNSDGRITVTLNNPSDDDEYYISSDINCRKFRKMSGSKINFISVKAGMHYITIMKNNAPDTITETAAVYISGPNEEHRVKFLAFCGRENIHRDGYIRLSVTSFDPAHSYEWTSDGGKNWTQFFSSETEINFLSHSLVTLQVRETQNNEQLLSHELKAYIPKRNAPAKAFINAPLILQNPELPTGCEITSLTMLLNHIGFKADKLDMSDNYLPKGKYRAADFYEVFVGNPRSIYAYGCYSKPIVKAAEDYLSVHDKGNLWEVRNITGCSPDSLYSAVSMGYPVVVWASAKMNPLREGRSWTIPETGKTVVWTAGEHCLLLTGYSKTEKLVYMNDPLQGKVSYNMQQFEKIFRSLDSHAIIIVPQNSRLSTKKTISRLTFGG